MSDSEGAEDSLDGKKPDKNRSDRGAKGRFAAGNTANPAGRPKGSRNQTTWLVEELLSGEAESLTKALIRRAKAGNAAALGLIFARLAPAPKDRPIQIPLAPILALKDVAAAHDTVVHHVANGDITPAEGQAITNLLDAKRRVLEATEMEARVSALEIRLAEQTPKGRSP